MHVLVGSCCAGCWLNDVGCKLLRRWNGGTISKNPQENSCHGGLPATSRNKQRDRSQKKTRLTPNTSQSAHQNPTSTTTIRSRLQTPTWSAPVESCQSFRSRLVTGDWWRWSRRPYQVLDRPAPDLLVFPWWMRLGWPWNPGAANSTGRGSCWSQVEMFHPYLRDPRRRRVELIRLFGVGFGPPH